MITLKINTNQLNEYQESYNNYILSNNNPNNFTFLDYLSKIYGLKIDNIIIDDRREKPQIQLKPSHKYKKEEGK